MMYLKLGAALMVALVIASLVATAAWYRGNAIAAQAEAAQARANLAVAVDANQALEATVGRMRATEAANAKATAELVDELAAIHKEMAETNDAIGELKESNADVAAYLRGAVPDPLRKLLDRP